MKKIIDFMLIKERLWLVIILLGLIPVVNVALEYMTIREADSLRHQAIKLSDIGRFEQAISISNEAIMLVTNKFGEDSTAVAKALTTRAKIYVRKGMEEHEASRHESAQALYAQAVTLYERALKVRIVKSGVDDSKVKEVSSMLSTVKQLIQEDRDDAEYKSRHQKL